jgi:hypothetical protein
MNYEFHYNKLIQRAKNRTLIEYSENHHIIPRCMGGTNSKYNLVRLTAREHFIAHLLLLKMHPNSYGLIKAVNIMCYGHNGNRSMNRMYGWLREKLSLSLSKSQTGSGNSQFKTKWIFNPNLKISKKINISDEIPEGWNIGRIIDFDLYDEKLKEKIKKEKFKQIKNEKTLIDKHKKILEKENLKIEYKQYILDLYDDFKNGNFYSVRQFCKSKNITMSVMTISNYWRKYIPEYKSNSKERKRYRING